MNHYGYPLVQYIWSTITQSNQLYDIINHLMQRYKNMVKSLLFADHFIFTNLLRKD